MIYLLGGMFHSSIVSPYTDSADYTAFLAEIAWRNAFGRLSLRCVPRLFS